MCFDTCAMLRGQGCLKTVDKGLRAVAVTHAKSIFGCGKLCTGRMDAVHKSFGGMNGSWEE